MHSSTPPSTETSQSVPSDNDLRGIITHLQYVTEQERTTLSRMLHDDLGGLLVSAVMDVGWAEQHLTSAEDVRERLIRVRQVLAAAIDLKRNVIEKLRPSLLDNFGLLAAFRWHVKHAAERTGIPHTESYPLDEPTFRPEALTGLFRIMQETLAVIHSEQALKTIHVSVEIGGDMMLMRIAHEHTGLEVTDVFQCSPLEMGSIVHRSGLLGGRLTLQDQPAGTVLSARFPLDRILAPAAEQVPWPV
jgi:signal transduction histidine kinase